MRRHGETSVIAEMMTLAHGRHLGMVRGGRSRRMQPVLQPGNRVDLVWQRDTLLAVARANGRIAPAARSLGVHRNTELKRLRRASAELGLDPRRPEDALRLMREDAGDSS